MHFIYYWMNMKKLILLQKYIVCSVSMNNYNYFSFVFEEILLFLLLSSYAYFYISILKMKITFYKLFCTFSKDFVKD